MSNVKPYKMQEEETQRGVAEPMVAYETTMPTDKTTFLSDDILVGAVRYAGMARKQGRMIPNSQVYERLSERMGWK